MAKVEHDTAKVVSRLKREGWNLQRGSKHDKYEHAGKPGVLIVVPRHKTLTPRVARNIAKLAGWISGA